MSTSKEHLAKMVDAMIKGDNDAVDANLKAVMVPKTRALAGIDAVPSDEPSGEEAATVETDPVDSSGEEPAEAAEQQPPEED